MTAEGLINGRIGFTGHQGLTDETAEAVADAIRSYISDIRPAAGVCSLAEGADQIFAELLLDFGSQLVLVVPCRGYEKTFTDESSLLKYKALLSRAQMKIDLDFPEPSEHAYLAAGHRVVQESDQIIAVWDGEESRGKGGTGDIVSYALGIGKYVKVIWPDGAARN